MILAGLVGWLVPVFTDAAWWQGVCAFLVLVCVVGAVDLSRRPGRAADLLDTPSPYAELIRRFKAGWYCFRCDVAYSDLAAGTPEEYSAAHRPSEKIL